MTDRLDELDYYTLLGVEDDAEEIEIRAAFQRFALRFHPDRHVGRPAHERDRAACIFRRGTEAHRVLVCRDSRRTYDEGLRRGLLRLEVDTTRRAATTRPPAPLGLDSSHPKARAFVSEAVAAMERGDLAAARLSLKVAVAHDPSNPAIGAKLAELEAASTRVTVRPKAVRR